MYGFTKKKKSKIEGCGAFARINLSKDRTYVIYDEELLNLNHGCEPNILLIEDDCEFAIQPLENIKSGEELLFDYRETIFIDFYDTILEENNGHCLCPACFEEYENE